MKFLLSLLLVAVMFVLGASVAGAQTATTTSLLDPSRLSVGVRAYRSFDEQFGTAGTYSSAWWAGASAAWELTSPKAVQLPVSLIAAIDLGMPNKLVRGYVGIIFLVKKAGQ